MERDEVLEFIAANHHAVLGTTRPDGRPKLTPVTATVDGEGRVVISSRRDTVKIRQLRRDPWATLLVMGDRFFGTWVQVEGEAEIVEQPEALEGLVDYYRRASGEHPNWDEYRAAMVSDERVLVRIAVSRFGPKSV